MRKKQRELQTKRYVKTKKKDTNDLFATSSFIFEITFILLDSVFFSLKLLVLLDSKKMLLYLYETKLIP